MMLTTQEKTKERLEKLALNISQPNLYQKRLRIKQQNNQSQQSKKTNQHQSSMTSIAVTSPGAKQASVSSFIQKPQQREPNYFNLPTTIQHHYADSMPESPVDSGRQSLMTFSEKKLLALNQIVDQSLSKAKAKQRKIKHKKALGSLIQSGTSNVNVGGGRLTT